MIDAALWVGLQESVAMDIVVYGAGDHLGHMTVSAGEVMLGTGRFMVGHMCDQGAFVAVTFDAEVIHRRFELRPANATAVDGMA